MNGRQARGWGISAHERMNTTTKKAANSIVGKLTAGILAAAAVAAGVGSPAAAPGRGDGVLVVGDSLEVGSGPYLRAAAAGTRSRSTRSRAGRAARACGVLAAPARPVGRRGRVPARDERQPRRPRTAGRATSPPLRQLAGDRCIVVATIARPRVGGVSVAGLNRVVERSRRRPAPRWWTGARSCGAFPSLLVRDGVHATGEGYSLRASLIAEAVQGCTLGGGRGGAAGVSGIPAPRNPARGAARRGSGRAGASCRRQRRSALVAFGRAVAPIAGAAARRANGSNQGGPGAGAGRALTDICCVSVSMDTGTQQMLRSELDLGVPRARCSPALPAPAGVRSELARR